MAKNPRDVQVTFREGKKRCKTDRRQKKIKHSYLNCKGCNKYFLFFLVLLKETKVKASSHNDTAFSTS